MISDNHCEKISLIFAQLSTPVLLGFPWLYLHNPHVDWQKQRILNWSVHCHANCLHAAPFAAAMVDTPVPDPPDLSLVPKQYHDLGEVFSKNRALSLPPHRPYDCSIDLLPAVALPSRSLYTLRERQWRV